MAAFFFVVFSAERSDARCPVWDAAALCWSLCRLGVRA